MKNETNFLAARAYVQNFNAEKKVPKSLVVLERTEDVVEFLMKREFTFIPDRLLRKDFIEASQLILPSEEYFASKVDATDATDKNTWRRLINGAMDEFTEEKGEIITGVYLCDSYYIDSDKCNVDVLAEFGIAVYECEGDYFLNIAGFGYSYRNEHFLPLFSYIGMM